MAAKTTKKTAPPLPRETAKDFGAKTLADLAADQGIIGPQDFNVLCGAGADLWDEADFERFVADIHESRQAGG